MLFYPSTKYQRHFLGSGLCVLFHRGSSKARLLARHTQPAWLQGFVLCALLIPSIRVWYLSWKDVPRSPRLSFCLLPPPLDLQAVTTDMMGVEFCNRDRPGFRDEVKPGRTVLARPLQLHQALDKGLFLVLSSPTKGQWVLV